MTPLEGIVLDRLVIGSAPGAFVDPGPGVRSQGTGIRITDAVSGGGVLDNVITDSLIGHNRSTGVLVNTNTGGWIVAGNEIRNTGTNPSSGRPDGLSVEGGGSTAHTISGNLIAGSSRVGIETWRSAGGHSIVNNDILNSSIGFSDETAGVRLAGPGNLVSKNRINGGTGPGVIVIGENTASPHVASINNLISQNEFGSNTGLAIDLVASTTVSAPHSTGDGLTLTPGTDPGTGNIGVDAPVITSASTTSVTGTACVGCTVEVYRAVSGAGDGGYGEGVAFVGSAVVGGGGTFTAAVVGVGTDDEVSAITIDGSNNTSEFGANLAVNTAPVLDPIGNQSVDELTALGFTATASDADSGDTLTFSLSGAPVGASITAGGVFSWTPTEAQGPGSYVFDVIVTDDATPAGSDSETITVTVNEVNVAPVLDPVWDQSVDEQTALGFTATASDADVPANTLTFSLVGAPAGASITPGGVFSWTPSEAQGPGSYTFDVVVTDDGTPALADSETITVTVNEVNVAPVVVDPGNQTNAESDAVSLFVGASDADVPANGLTWNAVGLPTGLWMNPATGEISGTIDALAGSGSPYSVTVTVTDDGAPNLNDSVAFSWVVTDVNRSPVLDAVGNQSIDELMNLSFTATASDPDLDSLTFSLVGAPVGASMTAGGAFSWTPTETQGPGSYTFDVVVTDDGTPALNDTETITVTVNEVNVAPTLTSPGDQTNAESDVVSVFAPATDPDLPANGLTWSATGLPAGLSISPATGEIAGTVDPLAAAGSPYSVTITVTDDGAPVANDSVAITWTVTDTNRPPVLDPVGDRVVDEQVTLSFTATASDPDLDSFSFSLSGAPAGASITPGGGFSWTPTEAQGPGSYTFDVIVSDNGVPVLTDTETITVTVNEVNLPPVPDPIADYAFSEYTVLNLTASASDPDDPANSISWSIVSGPAGATLTPAGDFSWTADETHGGSTYTFTLRATDDGVPAASGDVSFDVTVTEDNQPPWALPIADVTIDEQVTFSFTAAATDADIPANNLTWSLSSGPGFILPNGNYSWNPGEADGPGTYVVTLRVTDDGAGNLWDEEAFTITVDEVNTAPTPDPIANRTLDELDTVTVNATATDSDIPANSLSWTLDAGPGAVTPGGVYSWTPTEADGPGTYSVTLRVVDDGIPSLSTPVTFDVMVNEINNNVPVAVDDAYGATLEGGTRVVPAASGVLANDTDGDIPADPLSAVLVTDVSHGVLALAADGSFTYTHDGSENHTDSFTYEVFDGANTSSVPATVTLTMIPVSDQAPVAVDDSYGSVAEGGTLNVPPGGVLDNDYDGDMPAEPLTATLTISPAHGALTLNADGSFSYVHDGTENFTDTFEYEVSDGLETDTGTVSIAIDPVNDNPPVAFDGSYVLDEGGTLVADAVSGVLGSASDADGDPLTASALTAPVHGTLALLADGSFTYVHDGTENYLDGFTFEVTDGVHTVGPLPVLLSINPVNDAPTIDPAAFSVLENDPAGTVLGSPPATDADGDPLTYSFVTAVPEFSIASLTGEISTAAALDFETVQSYTVTVTVTDPSGASATADVSITVLDVDEPPTGAPAAFPIVEDLPLGSTIGAVVGSDPEGEPVTFTLTGGDPSGRFTMDPVTGELILVAPLDADTTPSYLLDVEISDPGGNIAPVAVIVIVNAAVNLPPINAAPLGVPDLIDLFEDGSVVVSPLLNDTDPDGDALLISWIDSPVNGSLTPRGDGTFLYRPRPNFSGTETLSYGITDGRGGEGTATVVLGISPLNDAPVTPDVFVSLEFALELLIPTPAIFDPDGDAISIVLGAPEVGAVELVNGAFLYRPEREWNGTDTFPYTATDSHGATSSGLVTVSVVQLDGDLVAIDLVTVEQLPEPDPGPSTGIVVDSIKLLVGTVTEMAGLLSVPVLAVGIAFLSSILFGLSRNFLIGRGPVFLPATAPSSVAIVRVPDGGVVTALEGPGEEYPLVHRYGPAERGIRSTGRRAQRGSTVWVEVETPSGDAWVIERLTTREISPGEFAADEAVAALIDDLGERIEERGDLSPLVSKYGLEVAYYAPPKHIGEGELESLLKGDESWGWWDPTGSTPSVRGEFVQMVADPLRQALEAFDGLPVAEAVVPIPVELINFPHLTFSAADKLGWRIFVDYDGDTPTLAAIWREGVTNPSSI
ncbi:MAG: tandem-95 repeat protein [Acidimicrobiia bacterium]|nr:tandem-95 repeat protein [Acidimicrobiia bacterium]